MTPLLLLAACADPDTRTASPEPRGGRPSRVDERFEGAPSLDDGVLRAEIASDEDDGLRTASGWAVDGEYGNLVVRAGTTALLRFRLAEPLGSAPVHARLVLPIGPDPSGTRVRVRASFDEGRLADVQPAAEPVVDWVAEHPLTDPWQSAPQRKDNLPRVCAPFLRTSPDLSPLLAGHEGATSVTLLLEGVEDGGSWPIVDRMDVEAPECVGPLSARLEVRPTVRSALVAHEMLGQPTDEGVTISLLSLVDAELQVVTRVIGGETTTVGPVPLRAGQAEHVPLVVGADASAKYHIELRRGPDDPWEAGPEHSFHTRRAPGKPFAFTVTADGHYINMEHRRAYAHMQLLQRTMNQIEREHPDFHLDLGDTFNGESYRSFDAIDDEEMARRHLAVRPWFEIVGAGAPVLLALGNHEGEQGWRTVVDDPVPALSARWRRALFPNPAGGDVDESGPLENYWATRWGDVLVVVLDPFRHTMRKPHDLDGHPGSGDRWDWTLGEEQQAWLRRTLQESDAPFKLVFSHQVVGGNSDYGRGGRPQLENGSYEMGGTGPDGRPAFAEHRPGWPQPLHELLRDTGVTAFVHGHDHAFVFEEPLDGVAYITAPQPGSADYDIGHIPRSGYDESATVIGNSGYLLFRTTPQGQLEMSYVRIRLPGDGVPRETAFQHAFERR